MRLTIIAVVVLAAGLSINAAAVAPSSAPAAAVGDPEHYAVCVTTIDQPGVDRFDSFHALEADARARRAAIVANGWETERAGANEQDAYPPTSIVKATFVDTWLDGGKATCPPPRVVVHSRARERARDWRT